MISWLNQNATLVSAIATAVSAFASVVLMGTTIVYAIYTWVLTKENRLLRKAGTDPQVVGYAILNPRVYGAIDFVIRNIGKGAARNVSYTITSGGEDLTTHDVNLASPGRQYAFLPQDEQISMFMGMGWDLLSEPALRPFNIEVRYEDISGIPYKEQFKIDAAQFDGLIQLGKPYGQEIAEGITKISEIIDGWSKRRLQVETMSVTERRKLDMETRRAIDERRKTLASSTKKEKFENDAN